MATPRLTRRVDNLEYRVDAMEKSHSELMAEIKPLKEAIAGMNFIQKAAAFLTVVASVAAGLAHFLHH